MMKPTKIVLIIAIMALAAGAIIFFFYKTPEKYAPSPPTDAAPDQGQDQTNKNMEIQSPVFQNNQTIPVKFTCDGNPPTGGISPALSFSDVPKNAKSLALIMDDPDAPGGNFNHWLVWNINPSLSGFEENSVPEGTMQGQNSAGRHSYFGPCPPSGTHHYHFKLYALDTLLEIAPTTSKLELENAMQGHIIENTEIIGLYGR